MTEVQRIVYEEYEKLIDEAWQHSDDAYEKGDVAMGQFWEEEALTIVAKLPKNTLYLVKSEPELND